MLTKKRLSLFLRAGRSSTERSNRHIENGASPIGGCCGTAPEHIAALKGIQNKLA